MPVTISMLERTPNLLDRVSLAGTFPYILMLQVRVRPARKRMTKALVIGKTGAMIRATSVKELSIEAMLKVMQRTRMPMLKEMTT